MMLPPCFSFAQNSRGDQEISVGYGIAPSDQLFDGWHFGFILSPTTNDYQNTSVSGSLFFDYKYFIGKRIAIGFFAGIEKESGNWFYSEIFFHPGDFQVISLGTFSRTALTFSPEITSYYIRNKHSQLYGTIGIGITFQNERDVYEPSYYANQNNSNSYGYISTLPTNETALANNKVRFNGYYSPLGYSFIMGGHIQGFMELGFGYKGLFNLGLSYKFLEAKHQMKLPLHSQPEN